MQSLPLSPHCWVVSSEWSVPSILWFRESLRAGGSEGITYSSSFRPLSTSTVGPVNHFSLDGEEENVGIFIFTWFANNFGCWRLSQIATGIINNIADLNKALSLSLVSNHCHIGNEFCRNASSVSSLGWAGTSVLNLLKTKVYLVCKFSPRNRNNMQL